MEDLLLSEKTNGFFDLLSAIGKAKKLKKALEEYDFDTEFAKGQIERGALTDELSENYRVLIGKLAKPPYDSVHIDRENIRLVTVNGKAYDFDEEFHHNRKAETERLCAIDAIFADLGGNVEVLDEVEQRI